MTAVLLAAAIGVVLGRHWLRLRPPTRPSGSRLRQGWWGTRMVLAGAGLVIGSLVLAMLLLFLLALVSGGRL